MLAARVGMGPDSYQAPEAVYLAVYLKDMTEEGAPTQLVLASHRDLSLKEPSEDDGAGARLLSAKNTSELFQPVLLLFSTPRYDGEGICLRLQKITQESYERTHLQTKLCQFRNAQWFFQGVFSGKHLLLLAQIHTSYRSRHGQRTSSRRLGSAAMY